VLIEACFLDGGIDPSGSVRVGGRGMLVNNDIGEDTGLNETCG
jgi:hypothetical protein